MTVLSAQSIQAAIDRGLLGQHGTEDLDQVQPASLDLTIGSIEGIAGMEGPGVQIPHNSVRKLGILERIFPRYRRPRQWEQGIQVWDNTYLITFAETVHMPNDKAALFIPRSSLMRMGVLCSVGLFDPGYIGKGQCLVHALGRGGFVLEEGARIGQLVFFNLDQPVEVGYRGMYQNEGINELAEEGIQEAADQIMQEPRWVVDVPEALEKMLVFDYGDGVERVDLQQLPGVSFPAALKRGDTILAVQKISSNNWESTEWPEAHIGNSIPDEVRDTLGSLDQGVTSSSDYGKASLLEEVGLHVPTDLPPLPRMPGDDEDEREVYESNNQNTAELIKMQAQEDDRIAEWDEMISGVESSNINEPMKEKIIAEYRLKRGERRDFIAEAQERANA